MKKQIIKLRDDIGEYAIKDVMALDFDLFVYDYSEGGYDGSGFAAWRKGKKYFYHELGHCSCDGPTDQIEQSAKVGISLTGLREIAKKSYGEYAKAVLAEIEKNR